MASLDLSRIRYFASVVEERSFSAAAMRLNVSKSVVSHQIATLEAELGAAVLVRTTRKLRLTPCGERLYAHCQRILGEAEAAIVEISAHNETPTGTLTVTAPQDFGMSRVTGAVARFKERFPDVSVDLLYDDRKLDFIEHQIDLSIQVGWLADSSAKARRIGSFEEMLVCSPERLAAEDLTHPSDLRRVPWVANQALASPLKWKFSSGKAKSVVTLSAAVSANGTQSTHACVLAGIGASVLPDYQVAEDLASGRLVRLLPEWKLRQGGIHLVFPPGQHRPAKVTEFVNTLMAHIRRT